LWPHVAKLSLGSPEFACRNCQRLAYRIENLDRGQRLWVATARSQRRLGQGMQDPNERTENVQAAPIAVRSHRRRTEWLVGSQRQGELPASPITLVLSQWPAPLHDYR